MSQWEGFIQQQRGTEWRASRWSSLCSRHFREDDFRSFNERKTLKKSAIPSVLGDCKQKTKKGVQSERVEDAGDKEITEILAIKERLEDVGSATKTNCRLCGIGCVAAATFAKNYELYGMLQKCFPTLNIQQEDGLPKSLCASCNRDLQKFGDFVDRVWTAQTELQRKYKSRPAEKPLKIKQEPFVRVKQEVAEYGYDQNQHEAYATGNEDYDVMADGPHEEGDDPTAVDHKYEFCDFPIINDCDIMEIINLDDPFINIPDDDNNEGQGEELERSNHERVNYLPTAHELLQEHLLMEEHNYAYIDTEEFKEERHVYKTEKTEVEERTLETATAPAVGVDNRILADGYGKPYNANSQNEQEGTFVNYCNTATSEKRSLKPIVTSVSAIQQPNKANNIIVLNESIVKSGGGFQLHECMVCQLKFFSIESLKEHYTQTHGTPMVSVPAANLGLDKPTASACKTEKEATDAPKVPENPYDKEEVIQKAQPINDESTESAFVSDTNTTTVSSNVKLDTDQQKGHLSRGKSATKILKSSKGQLSSKVRSEKRRDQYVSLNTMASHYQQLKRLYQKLQKKCLNLEQNVEQLQLHPSAITAKTMKTSKDSKSKKGKPRTSEANRCTSHTCPVCLKSFSNTNSFRQHKITHSEERSHTCSLCQRSFKRRNGLLQHLKGFHLQVKPYACPVCKHSYALKCDMLRCKHSALKINK